jgi:hypothetical protein
MGETKAPKAKGDNGGVFAAALETGVIDKCGPASDGGPGTVLEAWAGRGAESPSGAGRGDRSGAAAPPRGGLSVEPAGRENLASGWAVAPVSGDRVGDARLAGTVSKAGAGAAFGRNIVVLGSAGPGARGR